MPTRDTGYASTEDSIDIVDRSAADHRKPALQLARDASHQIISANLRDDHFRTRNDGRKRAVEVDEERRLT